jgi:thiol-disulfide isomerase/thioredoxin
MPTFRTLAARLALSALAAFAVPAFAAAAEAAAQRPDLVRAVRGKLSAADLASAEAIVEDWKRDYGTDATYWDAMGWLARGALMLGEEDRALAFSRAVQEGITWGVPEGPAESLGAMGAALETEGRIRASRDGNGAGAAFFREAARRSSDTAFRSRMWKNVNRLELVGQPAPPLAVADVVGAAVPSLEQLRGRTVLLFFWAHWCGDCRASAPTLARLRERFAGRGLEIVAPTRLYGTGAEGRAVEPAEEKRHVEAILADHYAALPGLAVPVDTETMVRWGASATPTFVVLDREGVVRLYAPTRLTEDALAAAIEPLLAPAAGQ